MSVAWVLSVGLANAAAQGGVKPALPPDQLPETAPAPPTPAAQEPAGNAQVRTGAVLGGKQDEAGRMISLLADHQFARMAELLKDDTGEGSGKLTPEQKDLFRGILANRENKPQESIRLLAPLLDKLDKMGGSDNKPVEKLLRKTLAEDYLRSCDLAKAAEAYQGYQDRLGSSLSPAEKDEIELPLMLLPLAVRNPPMKVEPGEAFSLPYDRDALGLTDVPVFVDAQSHDWMLDPTAPFNLICRSTAKAVGLRISEESATIHTLTGRPMQVHSTVIPRMTLGTVTFRNVTAFVFDDADYYFRGSDYQVRGVLGYPAVSALGRLTVTANARIEIEPGDKGERLTTGAPFYLDGDQLIVALGSSGDERMYVVDAGGQQTYLTSRYFSEHGSDFADKKMQLLAVPGDAKLPPAPAYVADSVKLQVGDTVASFRAIQVLTQPLGSAANDDNYGLLGMDALDALKSYSFDYRTMRFGVKTE